MKEIKIDDLLDEVVADKDKFAEETILLKTSKVASKMADIILNMGTLDPVIMALALSPSHASIVLMMQAACGVGFSMGRLYGRSELMQELEVKSGNGEV